MLVDYRDKKEEIDERYFLWSILGIDKLLK